MACRALVWTDCVPSRKVQCRQIVVDYQQRIGRRIRRARENRSWTQRELGDALGISEHQISRYENGRTAPKRRRYEDLAAALDVPAETFFYDPPGSAGG